MKRIESMARRIWKCLTLIALVCVLLTALGTAVLFHGAFGRQLDQDLSRTARAVAVAYDSHGVEALEDYMPMQDSLRLTLIQPDGTVLYDSSNAGELENHLNRPEVQAALTEGSGAATRKSRTVGYETHYYALRMSDGNILRLADDADDLWMSYTQALPWLAGGILVMLVLGALFAWWLTRRLVRPITCMADHLDDIEAYVPYVELEPLAYTVQQDRKLREDNETMRREFTANVSHELKTPLTSISGFAEMIETGMVRPEDIPGFAKRIHKEARRMISLVADILQLSELDSMRDEDRKKDFVVQPVHLDELVQDVAANMTVNAKKNYVTVESDARPTVVMGSSDLLSELITNLCDNAVRYNRPGGHVRMCCGTGEDGCPWFSVEDNGIGIPQERQTRVFERFYRVDKSRSKATGGTGLGLAIVKHIAMLHGARIDLKSQVGTGTTIRVTFPKPDLPAQDKAAKTK